MATFLEQINRAWEEGPGGVVQKDGLNKLKPLWVQGWLLERELSSMQRERERVVTHASVRFCPFTPHHQSCRLNLKSKEDKLREAMDLVGAAAEKEEDEDKLRCFLHESAIRFASAQWEHFLTASM